MERLQRLRTLIDSLECDACVLFKPENIFYFTGFKGDDSCLYCSTEDGIIITDSRYTEQARAESALEVIETNTMLTALADLVHNQRVLFEEDYLPYADYSQIATSCRLIESKGQIESLRATKDEAEIEKIIGAQAVTDKAFNHILQFIKPGITENELVAELEYFIKRNGCRLAFDTIVAFGAHASMPHAVPDDRKLQLNQAVLIDFGAKKNGYCSDMTRTVFLGKPNDETAKIYEIVLRAQQTAMNGICAGLDCRKADELARKVISDAGFGNCFGHGLGHGIGIACHEQPRLSPKGTGSLQNGMVVTVEPGIYLPDVVGVRIENMCVIKNGEGVNLTRSENKLTII